MNSIQLAKYRGYQNVMELLVAEEVERQLNKLPPKLAMYIRSLEVETYALNRLPSLYASSEKGWRHQCQKAKAELHKNIAVGVRQAFSAIQADPLRLSNPLTPVEASESQEKSESQAALEALRDLLQQPDLSWPEVVQAFKTLLAERPQHQPLRRSVRRLGTYGEASWQPKHNLAPKHNLDHQRHGWNNPLYSK